MKIEHKTFPMEVKEIQESGQFAGYLSVFNNLDATRDIVVPGAFRESLEEWGTKSRMPPILWQHRSGEPIGVFSSLREDEKGLAFDGKLLLEVQRAREAHALLKNGVISGMSMGFETIGEEIDKPNRARKLTKVKLWEGSVVTFPANDLAQVMEVRKFDTWANGLPDLQTFEKFLREAGFSKSQATAIASGGLTKLLRSESAGKGDEVSRALATLKSI